MAAFNGDKIYKGSTALAGTNDASLTILPEYALGAIAALGACFVGLVVFKKRTSLSHLKRL